MNVEKFSFYVIAKTASSPLCVVLDKINKNPIMRRNISHKCIYKLIRIMLANFNKILPRKVMYFTR